MERIKGTEVLKAALSAFREQTIYGICYELGRIYRPVRIDEFDEVPFGEEVRPYVKAIRLSEGRAAVLDTSFDDIKEKALTAFLADGEMDDDELITLLGFLQHIKGLDGKKGSVLEKTGKEYINFYREWDNWICLCGNHSSEDGFDPCDADGNIIEPVESEGWDELYRCCRCGRVINQLSHQVTGINLNPHRRHGHDAV